MSYIKLVWVGLSHKPIRTLLTFLSIATAFLLFGLLHGINQGMDAVVRDFRMDRLYVMNEVSMYHPLPIPYALQIGQMPEVKSVGYWAYFVGYYQRPNVQLPVVATNPKQFFALYPELKVNPKQLDAMAQTRTGALISKPLADRYGWKVGDRIPVMTSVWQKKDGTMAWYFDVVGTYEPTSAAPTFSDLFFINLEYFDEGRAWGQGLVHLLIVELKDAAQAAAVAHSIDTMFETSPLRTRTRSERAYAQVQWRQISDLRTIANAITATVLVTLLVVAGSTMALSVRERIPELAVLKTIGFSDQKVFALVCAEAFELCIAAALLGLSGAALLFPVIGKTFGGLRFSPNVLLHGFAIAVIVAILSSLLPALRAKRFSVAEALADRGT